MELGARARACGFRLSWFGEVGSTNDLALKAAELGDAGRHWFVAERQNAGRGRLGRNWQSPKGNLAASLLLISPCAIARTPLLGFVAGVALVAAIEALAPGFKAAKLKWPNDLLIGEAKAAGILLEGRMVGEGRQAVVAGIGVNVAAAPTGLPYAATALIEWVKDLTAERLFIALADHFAEKLALFDEGRGSAAILQEWQAHSFERGAPLDIRRETGSLSGLYAGLDEEGRLLLDTTAGRVAIEAGDVAPAARFAVA